MFNAFWKRPVVTPPEPLPDAYHTDPTVIDRIARLEAELVGVKVESQNLGESVHRALAKMNKRARDELEKGDPVETGPEGDEQLSFVDPHATVFRQFKTRRAQ